MRRFLIFILVNLGVARCSASDIIFPTKPSAYPPIEESLKNFQVHLHRYSNDIAKKLTTLEASLAECDPVSSETFEYRVQTEVFKHPLLNKCLKTAEQKMSDLAQIFEEDFTEVINQTKAIISERFDERMTVLQNSVDSVRNGAKELAGEKSTIIELISNYFDDISSQFKQLQASGISLPSKTLLANMTEALDDQIQIVRERSNNVSDCTRTNAEQIEDSLTKTREYERNFAQVKNIINTTTTKCPQIPSHLEAAVKMNTDTIENISNILKETEIKVLKFLDTPSKSPGFPIAQ